jgi:hypothetical protein
MSKLNYLLHLISVHEYKIVRCGNCYDLSGTDSEKVGCVNRTSSLKCRMDGQMFRWETCHLFIVIEITRSVKVKLSLCLTKHHDMKTYGGVKI